MVAKKTRRSGRHRNTDTTVCPTQLYRKTLDQITRYAINQCLVKPFSRCILGTGVIEYKSYGSCPRLCTSEFLAILGDSFSYQMTSLGVTFLFVTVCVLERLGFACTVHTTYKHVGYKHNSVNCTVRVWSRSKSSYFNGKELVYMHQQ